MDDEIPKQPSDRRLAGDINDLPPGPPGTENDDEYNDAQKEEKSVAKELSKSRRRSPSGSPPPSKRKSPSRGPRSPRGRRTPSPRRRYGRNRDYSPDRRRFSDRGRMRRSPIRHRSRDRMDHRRNGRDRFRGRRDSRSRSRSNSPQARRRWSPKKKPTSPPIPAPSIQYTVPAPGMYADAYSAYGQYGPPQQYVPADFVSAPPPAAFGSTYPPPPAWGVPPEGYPQQNWAPQPEPIPPAVMQPQSNVIAQQTAVVPPPGTQPSLAIGAEKKTEVNPTHDAIAQEAENQRDELKKQRTSYLKKTAALKKELKVLKEQRKDLIGGDGSHSPTTKGFLDENERLQSQIQKKLSTIENVIDMLTGIIGADNLTKDDEVESPKKHSKKKRSTSSSSSSDDSSSSTSSSSSSSSSSSDSEDNSSPERLKTKAIESMKNKRDKASMKEKKVKDELRKTEEKKINYVFYDPEMHWCKTCDAFPKTAKDFLTHLHSKEHSEHVDSMETPWHSTMISDEYPSFEAAPIKRTPIRGLTFFVPATSWYCKLCSVWMGDLHCASLHLKSKTHSNKYNGFLEKNPHFEVDWLADRQRVLNEKKFAPPPPQITSVSTTGGSEPKEGKSKSKSDDKEKSCRKRKKKGSDKKDKKKKKRSKKRKKTAASSSSSSHDSSSETEAKFAKKKLINTIPIPVAPAGIAAPSIRVQMRNLNKEKDVELEVQGPAPPPPKISDQQQPLVSAASPGETNKRDDLISQWNLVQPVISDKEKKLLEQLKGKLKNKPPPIKEKEKEEEKKKEEKIIQPPPVVPLIKAIEKKSSMEIRVRTRSPLKRNDDRSDKDNNRDRGGSITRRRSRSRPMKKSKSRSPSANRGRRVRRSRSRVGGGSIRRSRSRGRRSPSRGRYSPRGFGRRRRSRSTRRRSRSHGRSRRRFSSSRSRSRSRSGSHRIEKPIIRQPEFRPRVPEVSSVKKSKTKPNDEKEERKKSSSSSTTTAQSNKKLPFIGRMPVFKKHSQNSDNCENPEKKDGEDGDSTNDVHSMMGPMSMVQDSYSHAGYEPSMMCEYDDLMPDPVQFVSLMGAPPPPPSQPPPQQYGEEEKDILPPGIDETESEFVPKPISDAPIPRKGPLPKDFEEALNIIFPGEKKPDDDSASAKSSGETQIITDEPVMQQSDLIKEGIHMMTVEETSLVVMDEASQMSMNEPLQFNKPSSAVATPTANNSGENSIDKSPPPIDTVEEAVTAACVSAIPPPPPPSFREKEEEDKKTSVVEKIEETLSEVVMIRMPTKEVDINDFESNLDTIDQPSSPTESEKNRRQEELDDLAMLGIDADDMAAQCI